MTQRSLERSKEEIKSDIERQTEGTGTRARTDDRSLTDQARRATGEDLTAERNQFISRMEADVQRLQEQLENVAQTRSRGSDDVEDAREELNDLQQEISSLRNMDEQNWWEATRNRVDRAAERIEQSIEDLADRQPDRDRNR